MSLGIGNTAQNIWDNTVFSETQLESDWSKREKLNEKLLEELEDAGLEYLANSAVHSSLNRNTEISQRIHRLIQAGMSEDEAFKTVFYHMLLEGLG